MTKIYPETGLQKKAIFEKGSFLDRASQKTFFTIVGLLKILAIKYAWRYPSFLAALYLLNKIKNDIAEEDKRFEIDEQLKIWEKLGYKIKYLKLILPHERIQKLESEFNEYKQTINEIERIKRMRPALNTAIMELKQHLEDSTKRIERVKELLKSIKHNNNIY